MGGDGGGDGRGGGPMGGLPGDDAVLPFQLDHASIRGRLVRLDATLDAILGQHAYPTAVSALVADAALLTALIGQAMKLRWRFSLQIRAQGPVRLIATDWFAPEDEGEAAKLRAYASFDAEALAAHEGPAFALVSGGVIGVTIDQGPDMRPYQGITPVAGGSLSAALETYFAQSEQLATRFHTVAGQATMPGGETTWRAGGLMLQQLPSDGGRAPDAPSGEDGLMTADDVAGMGSEGEAWRRVNLLMGTVEAHEMIGPHLAPADLLYRLFHEEAPRVWDAQPVRFGCTCSAERVERALSGSSAAEIAAMIGPDGRVTADCQFCSARYSFAPEMLGIDGRLRAQGG